MVNAVENNPTNGCLSTKDPSDWKTQFTEFNTPSPLVNATWRLAKLKLLWELLTCQTIFQATLGIVPLEGARVSPIILIGLLLAANTTMLYHP